MITLAFFTGCTSLPDFAPSNDSSDSSSTDNESNSSGTAAAIPTVDVTSDLPVSSVSVPLDALATPGALSVCTAVDNAPFTLKKGKNLEGFDIDITVAIAKILGLTPRFIPATRTEISDGSAFRTKKCDFSISSLTITRAHHPDIQFTKPYYAAHQAVITANGVSQPSDGSGQTIGVQTGTVGELQAKQIYPQAEISADATIASLLTAVASKDLDAALLDFGPATYGLRTQPDVHVAATHDTGETYGIAVPRTFPNLLNETNAALDILLKSPTYPRIAEAWFGPGTKVSPTTKAQ